MGKDFQLHYHLAPPMIAKVNDKGELQKQAFGPWMLKAFGVLAKLKGLRGTVFDPFGRTEERRTERALVDEYRQSIDEVLHALGTANLALAVEIARVPEMIRGYGHVKARHLDAARPKWDALMADWRAGPLRLSAATPVPDATLSDCARHRAADGTDGLPPVAVTGCRLGTGASSPARARRLVTSPARTRRR